MIYSRIEQVNRYNDFNRTIKMKLKLVLVLIVLVVCTKLPIYPQDINKNFELGKNLMVLSKWADAANEFLKVLQKDPKHPDAQFNVSLCYFYLQEYDSADIFISKLIKQLPNQPDVNNLFGIIKLRKQDTTTAFKSFTKAIELDKNFTEALLNRGNIYIERRQYNEAYQDLARAAKLDTMNAAVYFSLARTEHNLEKYYDAIDHFRIAMENGYTNADIFLRRGNSYYKVDKYQEAIEDYTRVLLWEPLNVLAYNNRAFAFEKLGDKFRADQDKQFVAEVEMSKTLNPKDVQFVRYKSSDSGITMLMPERFNSSETRFADSTVILFHPDSLLAQTHKVAFRLKIVPFYSKIVGSDDQAVLIEHWRKVQDSAESRYYRYELFERKNKPYRSFPTIFDKIIFQEDPFGVASIVMNYGIVYGEHLIEFNFAIPLPLFFYYDELFTKMLESLSVNRIL